jgi:hypothetical protein
MSIVRNEARRAGLRAAAHVAAATGIVAAAIAAGHPGSAEAAPAASAPQAQPGALTERVAELLRTDPARGYGCVPKWGPPAPPAMPADLLDLAREEALS